ncbi:MAG: RNA methyltransferase [Ilumatobacter sp.]|uniref:TrmH family RNA methyltransferase n=1 Tax=Ilumatobacter sp. TaxID=1967498 RepID=UPI003C709275
MIEDEGAAGRVEGVTYIVDPADPRVDDYRELNSIAVRAEMEVAVKGGEFFMGEGYVPIDRMIDSGHRMRSVLLHPKRLKRFIPTMARPEMAGVPVYVGEQDVIADIVGFNMYRSCLASGFRAAMPTVEDLARSCRRIVVLEALNDDQNVGAIARAARAFGIDGIVISPTCNDPYQRRTVRVSMGEILHMPVARASADDWPRALETLQSNGFHTWAMTPDAEAVDLWDMAVPDRVAVVLGAEGHGLEKATMDASTHRVRIPISANVDSLNVGHAAAVTFAAVARPPRAR